MSDLEVIDRFLSVFTAYIDSGFGLVRGDVASLAQILVAIDVTLAALFWAWGPGEDILARLVKKTLYVGIFAFLIGSYSRLANIVYASFSGLGLKASGSSFSAADLLHPGRIARAGMDAGRPMLEAAGELAGFPAVFENLIQIAVLLFAFLLVLLAFFILAVQLFITLVEFKLSTLAGFVLVPFGLFGRTAFLAERVLGNVMASGVKVLVLAVVVGIGSGLFADLVRPFDGAQPDLESVLATALGALCLLGLGIFAPGIANGLISGGPQLGAGAAVGAAVAAGGVVVAGAAGVRAAVGAAGAVRAAVAKPRPPAGGGPAAGGSASPPPGPGGGGTGGPRAQAEPAWARRRRALEAVRHGAGASAHAVRSGDGSGSGTTVSLQEDRT